MIVDHRSVLRSGAGLQPPAHRVEPALDEVPEQSLGFPRVDPNVAPDQRFLLDAIVLRRPVGTGAKVPVRVTAANTGSTTWTKADLYRLGSQDPQDNLTWGIHRVELASSVDPGATATFDFTANTPTVAGSYAFRWQMVHDAVQWFGTPSPSIRVAVGSQDGVCEQLHNRHTDLAGQLKAIRDELAAVDWSDPFTARRETAALAAQARALSRQLDQLEGQQANSGCAPG